MEIGSQPLDIFDSGSNIQFNQKNFVALLNRAIIKDLIIRIETPDDNVHVSEKQNNDDDKTKPGNNSLIYEDITSETQMTITDNDETTRSNMEMTKTTNIDEIIMDNVEESLVADVLASSEASPNIHLSSQPSTKTMNNEQISKDEANPNDKVAMIIELRQLTTPEDLQFLINLEEKTIIPKYLKYGYLSSSERAIICRLIVKNLLKSDPTKE